MSSLVYLFDSFTYFYSFVATVYVTLYKKYCDIALILTSDYVHNKVVFNQL